ncbi:sugar phosphate nucleotidyltransferase [Paenibacillus alvei]|uniref:Glucose-1-phosphate thymidylyltransferase n=1 Tax=Paenibacillus alvei TaxID=44250 RepID=A0AAP7DKJ8_PAEAL|nr:sugar phosphate nucleotidyltransferase [Paenibacillus alvei]NOJ73030.1 NTP transferase domain-containing protein [Paenibacillus alvei]
MKGLILSAGKGSRVQPFSFTTPKPLLPVANIPLLYYCIGNLVEVGIQEIGIVIQPGHHTLFAEQLGRGERWGVEITYIYQHIPLGIADAVRQAESYIGLNDFVLMLGDNLITESLAILCESVLRKRHDACMLLGEVAQPQDYGIVEICDDQVIGLEEKPENPKSNLASLGAYVFTSNIFEAVRSISPSARGEYEITHAIQWLIDQGYSIGYMITDKNHTDIGTIGRWLEANHWVLDDIGDDNLCELHFQYPGCRLIPPVVIDPTSELKDCIIGPYVTVGPRAKISHCSIKNSIVLQDVSITNAQLNNVIANQHDIASPSRG